jgi:hypothetical protein
MLGDHTKNDEAIVPGKPAFAAPMDSSGKHLRWVLSCVKCMFAGTGRTKRSSRMAASFRSRVHHSMGIYWSWFKHCKFRALLVRTRTP